MAAIDWLWNVPEGTWTAHAAQGLLVAAIAAVAGLGAGAAVFALAYHFAAREGPGFVRAVRRGDTDALVDGMLDFGAPFVGLALFVLIFGVF